MSRKWFTYNACGASFGPAHHINTQVRILAICVLHAAPPAIPECVTLL